MRDLSEITPLECRYDSRDSFYGKALVKNRDVEGDSCNVLFSYCSFIAEAQEFEGSENIRIDLNPDFGLSNVPYSLTTGRHFKEWLLQAGVNLPKLLKKYGARSLKDLVLNKLEGTVFYAPLR